LSGLWFYLPSEIHVCLLSVVVVVDVVVVVVSGTADNWNFSAVQSPVELKFCGDHRLISRFDCFTFCKQIKRQNREKPRF
jgi:hypothetical protein